MIPSIETIVDDLVAGKIAKWQAVNWLNEYANMGLGELRDHFAGQALVGCLERMAEVQGLGSATFPQNCAVHAYRIADAMLAQRAKP